MENGEESKSFVPLLNYEGLYEINRMGFIRSLPRRIEYPSGRVEIRKPRMMKIVVSKANGYCYIGLCDANGARKGFRIHRLVAIQFIPNPHNLPEVNHEDFDKTNNSVPNLKWCDRFYQNQHAAKKVGRKWQSHRKGKSGIENFASKPVIVFDLNGNKIGEFESGNLAAIATKSQQHKVSACCRGVRKSHNNLKFQFA